MRWRYDLPEVGRTAVLEGGSREAWQNLAVWSREAAPLTVDLAHRIGRP